VSVVDSSLVSLIETAAEVAVQRALASMVQPLVRHGTIVTPLSAPSIHDVVMDGDAFSIPCHDVTSGIALNAGSRVTVFFAPPHQALIVGVIEPQGPIRQQILEVDDSLRTVSNITDMQLLDVPLVGSHTYGIHTHALVNTASVVAGARWEVRLNVNGSNWDRIWQLSPGVVGTAQQVIDSTVYYVPATTDDYDLQVQVTEVVNGMDIQLLGGADHRRTLTVFDKGILPELGA